MLFDFSFMQLFIVPFQVDNHFSESLPEWLRSEYKYSKPAVISAHAVEICKKSLLLLIVENFLLRLIYTPFVNSYVVHLAVDISLIHIV